MFRGTLCLTSSLLCSSASLLNRGLLYSPRLTSPFTSATAMPERATEVLQFWFPGTAEKALGKYESNGAALKLWYAGSEAVDEEIRKLFGADVEDMRAGKLDSWKDKPESALAGVILMDQFSRNLFRKNPKAFAMDAKALTWAKYLLDNKLTDGLPRFMLQTVFMPFMHSEELADQERCVALHKEMAAEVAAQPNQEEVKGLLGFVNMATGYAEKHRDLIAKWGRFPHRNETCKRENTAEEAAGLLDGSIAKF